MKKKRFCQVSKFRFDLQNFGELVGNDFQQPTANTEKMFQQIQSNLSSSLFDRSLFHSFIFICQTFNEQINELSRENFSNHFSRSRLDRNGSLDIRRTSSFVNLFDEFNI